MRDLTSAHLLHPAVSWGVLGTSTAIPGPQRPCVGGESGEQRRDVRHQKGISIDDGGNESNSLPPIGTATSPDATADVPIHMIQVGPKRTATTLQYQSVCLSLFLKLYGSETSSDANSGNVDGRPQSPLVGRLGCSFSQETGLSLNPNDPVVLKMHFEEPCRPTWTDAGAGGKKVASCGLLLRRKARGGGQSESSILDVGLSDQEKKDTWLFTTSKTKDEGVKRKSQLQKQGYSVVFVQDMEAVTEKGHNIVYDYARLFGLTATQRNELVEYVRFWDILRVCCGVQMSKHAKKEIIEGQVGQSNQTMHSPNYHACSMYDIDEVERMFMNTKLYAKLMKYGSSNIKSMARPSQMDGELTGTYCSRYNQQLGAMQSR